MGVIVIGNGVVVPGKKGHQLLSDALGEVGLAELRGPEDFDAEVNELFDLVAEDWEAEALEVFERDEVGRREVL